MQVTLNQAEIETAIINYVNSHAIDTSDKQIDVVLTAGRKGNGCTAVVDISSKSSSIRVLTKTQGTEGIDMPEHLVEKEDDEEEAVTEDTNIFGAA